jgi:endonuclease YncB( thermonuclease family)
MILTLRCAALALALLASAAALGFAAENGFSIPAGRGKALDGDTIALAGGTAYRADGSDPCPKGCRVRLRGIDAPEKGEPGAEAARAELQRRLDAGTAEVEAKARDKYERIVAIVRIGGVDIGAEMKRAGFGKPR